MRHENGALLRIGNETVWADAGFAQLGIGEQARDEDVTAARQVGDRIGYRHALRVQSSAGLLAAGIDHDIVAGAEQSIDHRFAELSGAEEPNDIRHCALLFPERQ